jgi:hypothetical protein
MSEKKPPDKLTVRFEIHEGDVTRQRPWPLPRVGILEILEIDFVEGQWVVTDPDAAPEWGWTGQSEWRIQAILNYLQARLGMPPPSGENESPAEPLA